MRLRDRMNNDLDGVEYNSDEEDEEEEEEEWSVLYIFMHSRRLLTAGSNQTL